MKSTKHIKNLMVGAVLIAEFMSSAMAADVPKVPKALELALKSGMTIDATFPAPAGLNGHVISRGGAQPQVLYTTADGKYVIAGALVDEFGKNLTTGFAEQYIPKPDYSKDFPAVEKSAYIVEGATNPKTIIYAFMDPNCIYCHLMWKGVVPYEKVGLQVRWIPVAFLKPDSKGKAAALLESKNPRAMEQHHMTFDGEHETGGITPQTKVSAETSAKLDANWKLMSKMGFGGTPVILFKDAKTGKVTAIPGMPKLGMLPTQLGLPAQPIPKDLERFR